MFTGLVEDVGRIETAQALPSGKGRRLVVVARLFDEVLQLGESVAVDGVCLTVTACQSGRMTVEAGPETLACTTLGGLAEGASVNLERALKLGDRLGGHLVAGHVDRTGRIARVRERGSAIDVLVEAEPEVLRYVIEKGSVAVDGISLTVNQIDRAGFEVSLIPHTQGATTLATKGVGAPVNLEVDLIGKYVEKLLGAFPAKGLTLETLQKHGFA